MHPWFHVGSTCHPTHNDLHLLLRERLSLRIGQHPFTPQMPPLTQRGSEARGAEPEDMLRLKIPALIVPGRDKTHATSAARYLEECLPGSEYWDVAVADQTEATVAPRLLQFLDGVGPWNGIP